MCLFQFLHDRIQHQVDGGFAISQKMWGATMCMSRSQSSELNQLSSAIEYAVALCSASMLEHDTGDCFFDNHDTGLAQCKGKNL